MHLSVVIPVMNEQGNIQPLIARIAEALGHVEHELIFVDDGSNDRTVAEIERFATPTTRVLVLNRNYGQTTAMAAGIDAARGELIVMLDGDMQNDPDDIPLMMERMRDGDWDVVAGVRSRRKDGFLLRKLPSKLANWLIRRVTGVHISDYGCTLKLFKSDVAKNLELYGELHRYIPVLATMYGARMTEMPVRHHARHAGVSKYGLSRTLKVASDLMLMVFIRKYGQRPMHLFGTAGLVSFCAGCLLNIYVLFDKLMGATIAGRPLLFLGLLLTVAGIQLITTGFLADLMMRTYYESQNKKPYRIKRSTGAQAFQQEVESSLAAPVIDLPDRFRPSKS